MGDFNKTFQIDYSSDVDDRRYVGTFTTKKLTIGDLSKLGLRKAQLCGGHSYDEMSGKGVDPATAMLNEMVAHCDISLLQKPEWFVPEDLTDVSLLRKVYEEVASFEANFHNRSKRSSDGEESSRVSEDEGGDEHQRIGGSPDSFEDLVDKKVPKITPI